MDICTKEKDLIEMYHETHCFPPNPLHYFCFQKRLHVL